MSMLRSYLKSERDAKYCRKSREQKKQAPAERNIPESIIVDEIHGRFKIFYLSLMMFFIFSTQLPLSRVDFQQNYFDQFL